MNRAERRRLEKEQGKTEENYGPIAPRTFDHCPVCKCPARFVEEAMKGDLDLNARQGKIPALGSFEYIYETPLYPIKLIAVVDSCVKCGAIYTVARDKLKGIPKNIPKPSGLIRPN